MSELWRMSALELAEQIHTKQTSRREILAAHLERIDEANPHLNAVVRRLTVAGDIESLVGTFTPIDPIAS